MISKAKPSARALTIAFGICVALLISSCDMPKQYARSAEFKSAVHSWKLKGTPITGAINVLRAKGFICDSQNLCSLEASDFVCNQQQSVKLTVAANGLVESFKVAELADGKLPSACL